MFHNHTAQLAILSFYILIFKFLERINLKNNTLEEIEILKAASSKHLLNDVIAGQNDPI